MIIRTTKKREVIDITDVVARELAAAKMRDGVVHLALLHTTAALTTADLDPGTDLDMLDAFDKIVPKFRRSSGGPLEEVGIPTGASGLHYRHPHDPEHVPDHILSSLIGTQLTLPVADGALVLGAWQRVVLVELDGPRERQIVLTALPATRKNAGK
jgi:thiamine phosphate synthase YjbQ (UPF0047 family)